MSVKWLLAGELLTTLGAEGFVALPVVSSLYMIIHCLLRFVSFVAMFKDACELDAGLTTLSLMVFLAFYRCEELDTMLTAKPVLLVAFINPLPVLWVFMISDNMRNY